MLNLADYILHFFPFSNNIKTSGSWQILWMWILLWTPIGARTCDWLSIQKWGIIQFCETTAISWKLFEFEVYIERHLLGSDGDTLLFEQLLEGQDWGNNWKVNPQLRRLNNCHRKSHKQRTQSAKNTNQERRLQHHTQYQPSQRHKPGDKLENVVLRKIWS